MKVKAKSKIRIKRFGPLGRPRYTPASDAPTAPNYKWTVMVPSENRPLRMSFPTWPEAFEWALKIIKIRTGG